MMTLNGLSLNERHSFDTFFQFALPSPGSLAALDLSQNGLTGDIPSELGKFPSNFMVHLNGNSNM